MVSTHHIYISEELASPQGKMACGKGCENPFMVISSPWLIKELTSPKANGYW